MVPKGAYGFSAVAYDEINEVLGRITGLESSAPSFRSVMDFYRYTAPSQLAFNYWTPSYVSLNGGVTNLQSLNVTGGGDHSDLAPGVIDTQLATMPRGLSVPFGAGNWSLLDALGFNQTQSAYLNGAMSALSHDYASYTAGVAEPRSWITIMLGIGATGACLRTRRRVLVEQSKQNIRVS